MKRFLYVLAGLTAFGAAGLGQVPGQADPSQAYAITPEVGPWTICTASFSGEPAARLAQALVVELRTQYRLPAYFYNRGAEERRLQQQEIQEKRRRQEEYLRQNGIDPANVHLPLRTVRIEDQYVVLIGGFRDMDTARKELDRIKKLQPPRSVPRDVVYQGPDDAAGRKEGKQTEVNPFRSSFVVPNPTVPVARAPANQPDPAWKRLNAEESYSLLKCPKPWTLAIKEYQGPAILQSQYTPNSFFDKLFSRSADQLSACAINAHNMAEILHKFGFKAYVLHTRTSSIVTVGEFDRPDDPRMNQVKKELADRVKFHSNDQRFPQGVTLFAEPRPMEVPRF